MDDAFIEIVHSRHECLVVLAGEIDSSVRPRIHHEVIEALATCLDDAPRIVVDLARVTFFDSSALGALVQIRAEAAERGQSVILKDPSPPVRKVLKVSGTEALFPVDG